MLSLTFFCATIVKIKLPVKHYFDRNVKNSTTVLHTQSMKHFALFVKKKVIWRATGDETAT